MVVRWYTFALSCALLASAAAVAPAPRPNLAEVSRLLIAKTNEFRAVEGAGRTEPDAKLAEAAQRFASYMARTDRYGHNCGSSFHLILLPRIPLAQLLFERSIPPWLTCSMC